MAKNEKLGYCPNNAVAAEITKPEADQRLLGLWDLIGSSFVCKNETQDLPVNTNSVNFMLSADCIAVDLLKAIIAYNPKTNMVSVRQIFNGGCNVQKTSDIQKILAEREEPVLVLHTKSRFTAIVCKGEAEDETVVYFWDLNSTWNN